MGDRRRWRGQEAAACPVAVSADVRRRPLRAAGSGHAHDQDQLSLGLNHRCSLSLRADRYQFGGDNAGQLLKFAPEKFRSCRGTLSDFERHDQLSAGVSD